MTAIFEVLKGVGWILLGIVLGRLLDKPIDRWQRKALYLIQRIWVVTMQHQASNNHSEFTLGRWHVPWVAIEGSSSDPYVPKNVICQLDPRPLSLPQELQERKAAIENEQTAIEQTTGCRTLHNGPTLALDEIGRGQLGDLEEPVLILRLRPSDYYTFLATAMSLDEKTVAGNGTTIRDKYLHHVAYDKPVPEFASAFAVQMTLITSDGYIMVSTRETEGIVGYPGHLAPAINECVNPVADRGASGTISLPMTVKRGAAHELNIEVTDDEMVFFTVGVDPRYYMYTLSGLVRSKQFTRDQIVARRSLGSKERWEASQLHFLPHDVNEVARFMSRPPEGARWSPYGHVCLAQTLISEFGLVAASKALSKYGRSRAGLRVPRDA